MGEDTPTTFHELVSHGRLAFYEASMPFVRLDPVGKVSYDGVEWFQPGPAASLSQAVTPKEATGRFLEALRSMRHADSLFVVHQRDSENTVRCLFYLHRDHEYTRSGEPRSPDWLKIPDDERGDRRSLYDRLLDDD